jgi:hypothetical protein
MSDENQQGGSRDRSAYRDNDDQRDRLAGDERSDVRPDSKSEARGDAREQVGNDSRGTDRSPVSGPEGNDKTRNRPTRDEFDEDLGRG